MEALVVLILEILFVSFIVILLYHQKKRFGLVLLYIFIGSNQYFQTILSSTTFIHIFNDYSFSPGSVVLFSSSIFAILLIYIKEGVHKTRTLIYGIIISNITLTILSYITSIQITSNYSLYVPKEIIFIDFKIFLIGTFTLIIDAIMIIILYDFLIMKIKTNKMFLIAIISMLTTLYIDTFIFSTLGFWEKESFHNIFIGNIIGKSISGFLFALILYYYLVYIDKNKYIKRLGLKRDIKDVFSIITYRERYENLVVENKQIEEIKNNLIESNKNKDRFFSIISHDLKSPFSAILGLLKIMDSNFDSLSREKIKTYLGVIHKSSKDAFELLSNLLDWSRIQMDKIQINPTSFCINEIINESINTFMINAVNKEITILFNSSIRYYAYADKNMTSNVIRNLISNAIKFTNNGGVITIVIGNKEENIITKVQDNGVGIEKEVIEKILNSDVVKSSRGTNKETGTGLGLILSVEFLKKNKGSLFVESQIDKGSIFTFTLPQSRID